MELYLDTGNVEEVRKVVATGMLSGVTTNPSLIAKEGRDFKTVIREITGILRKYTDDFTVSAEVNSVDWNGMVKEGLQYASWDKHVIVKVPMTQDGIIAVQKLRSKRIRTNVTLCFSPNQALLAAKAGAFVVSPFVGRVDDSGGDGMQAVREMRRIFDNYKFGTKILVASVRHPGHVRDAALAGADIATMPFKVFELLFTHPLTDKGIAQFQADEHRYRVQLEERR